MALNQRQLILYTYRVSIFVPTDIGPYPNALSATDAAADVKYVSLPAYTNVPCFFVSTPEVDLPSAEGLNKETNIFTLDRFSFDIAQVVNNGNAILITFPQVPGVTGGFWYVQDNPKSTPALGNRKVNANEVFAKRGPDLKF
jgi:hypothetical protein